MLTANGWNVCQYAALLSMIARATGFIPGELVHVIADAHIYDRHVPLVEKLNERENEILPAPKLVIEEGVDDFYAFNTENVYLDGYKSLKGVGKIPVAI